MGTQQSKCYQTSEILEFDKELLAVVSNDSFQEYLDKHNDKKEAERLIEYHFQQTCIFANRGQKLKVKLRKPVGTSFLIFPSYIVDYNPFASVQTFAISSKKETSANTGMNLVCLPTTCTHTTASIPKTTTISLKNSSSVMPIKPSFNVPNTATSSFNGLHTSASGFSGCFSLSG